MGQGVVGWRAPKVILIPCEYFRIIFSKKENDIVSCKIEKSNLIGEDFSISFDSKWVAPLHF